MKRFGKNCAFHVNIFTFTQLSIESLTTDACSVVGFVDVKTTSSLLTHDVRADWVDFCGTILSVVIQNPVKETKKIFLVEHILD